MLVHQGEQRSYKADQGLAWWLAGVAGALNTAGLYAVGMFSANMTGNVSAFADRFGVGDLLAAIPYLGLVLTFIAGATISTVLINYGRRRGITRIFALNIVVEALLLMALSLADYWMPPLVHSTVLAFGLAFVLGLQNAVVTRISNARVRTTHVTGMVTDIGIELANLLEFRGVASPDARANRDKLRLHLQTVTSFVFGGIIGVIAYRRIGVGLLLAAATILLVLAIRGLVQAGHLRQDGLAAR
ncbi:DUF1275 domain-containing protein [Acidisoma cellulosilytica]|uniref:DUF1275 domain-containing protein n=1 Tax=Acidisoma cellulosilyticum TaxID=2802395 RepID=A0A964E4M6_9PROT|nr:YoaK family protein [Acidisoma cellulosilyticum]MCB8881654.1 DUF1275 domain-containing protein [Acidisoma cellulosilyticum]